MFGFQFLGDCLLCYGTIVLSVCLSVTFVYCGQMVGWIKLPLGLEVVGLGPAGDIALDGNPTRNSPHGKGHSSPSLHFSAHVYCGQTVAHLSNC